MLRLFLSYVVVSTWIETDFYYQLFSRDCFTSMINL